MPKWIIVLLLVFQYPDGKVDMLEARKELKAGSTRADCERELENAIDLALKQPVPNLKSVTGVCQEKK